MEALLTSFLPALLPIVTGIIVQPIMGQLKKVVRVVDNLKAPIQQMVVVGIAWGLTEASSALNVALPTNLSLVTNVELSSAIAAGIAMAIHAGMKSREEPPKGL